MPAIAAGVIAAAAICVIFIGGLTLLCPPSALRHKWRLTGFGRDLIAPLTSGVMVMACSRAPRGDRVLAASSHSARWMISGEDHDYNDPKRPRHPVSCLI